MQNIVKRGDFMNQELINMTDRWKSLERKTAKQRERAEIFYENKLMKLIEKEFIINNQEKVYEKVEYLILSVGTSYEPLVLDIQLLQPRRILFLHTENTEYILDKVTQYCKLGATRYIKEKVDGTNPLDIYKKIKGAYLEWKMPEKLYIDFTGGTKAMSAAAAMAGAVINVQLIYIGTNDYLIDFRKPNPGTESLYYIANPMEIFGDLEIEKAFSLFDKYNYAGAKRKLELLKENVPDPDIRQQLTFVYDLALTYEHWDALEFSAAYKVIGKLTSELERDLRLNPEFVLMDFWPRLKKQEAILKNLNELSEMIKEKKNMKILKSHDSIVALMFTLFISAEVREKQEKYDMATLLLYRLLEMIEQKRLAKYNLYVGQMNYREIQYDFKRQPELKGLDSEEKMQRLKTAMALIKKELFKRTITTYLPEQISLLDGFILLLVLNDEIYEVQNENPIDKLKQIRAMVYLRNNSIFAHGLGPVSLIDFQRFRRFVVNIFKDFCNIEKIDFDNYVKDITWLNPTHSANYVWMEERGKCQ